jgi:hydrogenase maturation protein HypF
MSSPSKGSSVTGGNKAALRIIVSGKVQGIGFRPAVYREAKRLGIYGFISNSSQGAVIEAEGPPRRLKTLISRIAAILPGQARILRIDTKPIAIRPYRDFSIKQSLATKDISADLPADLSVCPDCLRELFDPGDRRYLYPFINCTQCGPRFSIAKSLPYDRPATTMSAFRMCADCETEYAMPSDRRFHAQPNACPVCGPQVRLLSCNGREIARQSKALVKTAALLAHGRIVAIKSLGGYHLSCDAQNRAAVMALRKRKDRPHKPFALMVRDTKAGRRIAYVDDREEELLSSTIRPIVLLAKRTDATESLGTIDAICPANPSIGVMLPYTPLHYLLFAEDVSSALSYLVMTSGNRRDEPIACTEDDAFDKLNGIADYFLVHDRPIHNRCDDSIVRAGPVAGGGDVVIRRSRGYVPEPVRLSLPKGARPAVFATGAEQKNTFCLTRGTNAYLSPYIGDLDTEASLSFYMEARERFTKFLSVAPRIVAHDLHPDYLSSALARKLLTADRSLKEYNVQHHHAHIASVLAEKNLRGPAIGFAFDGTGLGLDGNIWGGECFVYDNTLFRRAAHFEYFSLPGGDAATREPWRIALALLKQAGIDAVPRHIAARVNFRQVKAMIENDVNCPRCCSVGRLFDAVAALIGVQTTVTFEAQAAIALEALAGTHYILPAMRLDNKAIKVYNFDIKAEEDAYIISIKEMIRNVYEDYRDGTSPALISARLHETLAEIILQVSMRLSGSVATKVIVLSGGVFQNRILLSRAVQRLTAKGFSAHYNTIVPPNDGGIALGQAWLALRSLGYKQKRRISCV